MSDTPETVLVVDDTHENLRLLSGILKQHGYGVRLAPGGQVAIESVQAQAPDLILLDIMMPGMDGYEVCKVLKADERTSGIPIIFISALQDTFDKVKAFNLGGVDYITKPFQVEEVLARVATHLSLRRMQQQVQEKNRLLQEEVQERTKAQEALAEERALLAQRVRERTEALSIASAELVRAAKLKDEFLANVSHELRTPLNTILGLSDALREEAYGVLDERQHEPLQMIVQSGRQLLKLITDMLTFSRLEAGSISLTMAPCLLLSVCETSLMALRKEIQQKSIQATFDLDETGLVLMADEQWLKKILVILLDNAVKFTPEGGSVGINVTRDPHQHMVRMTVWDTGVGISATRMSRLFKPFVQGDGSLSRSHEGIGLGLILAYRLTRLHGGSITVTSEGERGSEFTLAFAWDEQVEQQMMGGTSSESSSESSSEHTEKRQEMADEREAAQHPAADSSLSLSVAGATVLLVEESEETIRQIRDHMSGSGYRLVVARTGLEAVERAKEESPLVIMVDCQVQGMHGAEIIQFLRADPLLAHIPIVALSSLVLPGHREHCLASGASDYLVKPVNASNIVNHIESLHQHTPSATIPSPEYTHSARA
jgi:signal transduction histidine kinase